MKRNDFESKFISNKIVDEKKKLLQLTSLTFFLLWTFKTRILP